VPYRPFPALLAAAPAVLLLLALPGCGRFDRGPAGHWDELAQSRTGPVVRFEPAMVEGLPDPARRFLLWSIEPGTPLARTAEVSMSGTIILDPARGPIPMEAVQVLTPPEGFIWSARTHGGLMRIRGYDRFSRGEGEMRWKLFGLIPVMRATGEDVTRSAAARLLMEGVMVPAFLVPAPDAGADEDAGEGAQGLPRQEPDGTPRWEAVDERHARYRATVAGEEVVTTVEVDPDGRPLRAWAERWNEGIYERFQVELSGEITSGGYRIPSRVQAGWRLGDPDEFRFFDATLTGIEYR
jgi:hypothetical protein